MDEHGVAQLREQLKQLPYVLEETVQHMWASKLGVTTWNEQAQQLWSALQSLMQRHPTDFTNLFRQLASVLLLPTNSTEQQLLRGTLNI